MIYFQNDYLLGAHPEILKALIDTNDLPMAGYGSDTLTLSAQDKIKHVIHSTTSDVYFLTGGTQTNKIVIDCILDRHEGVISASTGHIFTNEAGAIEASGHKVLTIPSLDGKISAEQIKELVDRFYQDPSHSHKVHPGMIYLTHPTELGTMYTKSELTAIYDMAQQLNLPVFIDGARLLYALAADKNDIQLSDLAQLSDIFYIGGTKAGLLCGEAIIFKENMMPSHFFTFVKQNGALNAKGRLIGAQFDRLFTDYLWQEIGQVGIQRAKELVAVFEKHHIEFYLKTPTNQQFVILDNDLYHKLSKNVQMTYWSPANDEQTVVRFVTSWSTKHEDITALDAHIESIKKDK